MTKVRNVKKNLATMEDIAQGKGTVSQTRGGNIVSLHRLDVPLAIDTTAEMSGLDVTKFTRARVYSGTIAYTDYVYDADDLTGIASDTGLGTWLLANQTINDLSQASTFDTVAEYKASTIVFPVGKTIHLNDRGADFKVIAGNTTGNIYEQLASTTVNQGIKMKFQLLGPTTAQFGVLAGEDVGPAINHALSLPQKEITVSKVDYIGLTTINTVSGGRLWGLGTDSKIKVQAGNGTDFITSSATFNDFIVDGVHFDGTANYPSDYTTNKNTITGSNSNIAIYILDTFENLVVRNCFFTKMSFGSIYLKTLNSKIFKAHNNTFVDGSYAWKSIGVFTTAGYTEAQKMQDAFVYENNFTGGGVKLHYDAGDASYSSSTDCIQFDAVNGGRVNANQLKDVGGVGVRLEESNSITTYGNGIDGTGQEGITQYIGCTDCTTYGNTIKNWGQTIPYYSFRSYGGSYYIARETPNASSAVLPANPSTSPWFVEHPYEITGVDVSTIIAYSATGYLASNPTTGILPFRGYAAISLTNGSTVNSVYANTCTGNLEQNSGKYVRASDFGITPLHSVNDPTSSPTGLDNIISGNTFKNTIQYDIYHPRFMDPINENGKLGLSKYGDNILSGDPLTKVVVFSNNGGAYERRTFTPVLTSDGGTVTINPSSDKLNYTRAGNLVTITGKIRVSAISSPTGALKLGNLPYPIGFYGDEAEIPAGTVLGINLATDLYGALAVVGEVPGSTDLVLYRTDTNTQAALATSLTSTTQFTFSVSYMTGE